MVVAVDKARLAAQSTEPGSKEKYTVNADINLRNAIVRMHIERKVDGKVSKCNKVGKQTDHFITHIPCFHLSEFRHIW